MNIRRVLLIEDSEAQLKEWTGIFEKAGIRVSAAETPETAQELLLSQPWDGILFDGCLGGSTYNTEPLIRQAKEAHLTCPLVAASQSHTIREKMMIAGCSVNQETKLRAANYLVSYLKRLKD